MPALQSTRQASQAPWFDSEPAEALRVLERQLLLPQLSLLPTRPWLWIALASLARRPGRSSAFTSTTVVRLDAPSAIATDGAT